MKGVGRIISETIEEVSVILSEPTKVYIDWQNVLHWQEKLGCCIFNSKKIKQFFDSFDMQSVSIYTGTFGKEINSQR